MYIQLPNDIALLRYICKCYTFLNVYSEYVLSIHIIKSYSGDGFQQWRMIGVVIQ